MSGDHQGRYAEAETFSLQSLEMRQRLHHEDHLDKAIGLGSLGTIYTNQGKYAKAEPSMTRYNASVLYWIIVVKEV